MPNRNYQRGVRVERLAVRELREMGYCADRTAGSHGVFDVHAWNETEILKIQCKAYLPSKTELKQIARDASRIPACKHVKIQLWLRVKGKWIKKELKRKGNLE